MLNRVTYEREIGVNSKKKWTIKKSLIIYSLVQVASLFTLGCINYYNSNRMMSQMKGLSEVLVPLIYNMGLTDMVHDGLRGNVYSAIVHSGSPDKAEITTIREEAADYEAKILGYWKVISGLKLDDDLHKEISDVDKPMEEYIAEAKVMRELALSGKLDEAMKGLPSFFKKFKSLEKELDDAEKKANELSANTKDEILQHASRADIINLLIIAIFVMLSLTYSFFLVRSLQKQLSSAIESLVNQSQKISNSSTKLNTTSQELAHSTTQQASALQETAAAVDEITAMVKKTADNSDQLDKSSQSSNTAARRGSDSVVEMMKAIAAIAESNTRTLNQIEDGNSKIGEIVKVISEIGNKTRVINDIVFQTKLLSFNASVEAARAGEHGKGFAVVAEEVGNLAQMSGNAAREISEMLNSGIQKAETIVQESRRRIDTLMQESKSKLDLGESVAKQCKGSLDEIVRQSEGVSALISEITTAIREQSLGIQEISKALGLLDSATHKNSITSQETSSTSEKMLGYSKILVEVIDLLLSLTGGKGASMAKIADSKEPDVESAPEIEESPKSTTLDFISAKSVPEANDPRFKDI